MELGQHISDYARRDILNHKKCWHCNKPIKHQWEKEIHHLKPRSLGGANTVANCVLVHKKCHTEADKKAFEKYGGTNGNK